MKKDDEIKKENKKATTEYLKKQITISATEMHKENRQELVEKKSKMQGEFFNAMKGQDVDELVNF
jgi:hypothetical protein